ncbi:periplasmic heavy metal sensor [Haloferula sp.]|uniref:periplasmic heavy metal sensor n=1 Tax=Haloferula sp. TaxID=2497595 RepID=UPI003C745032
MRKGVIVLVLALIAGLCAFTLMRSHKHQQVGRNPGVPLLEAMPELTWLREELSLSDSQFEKISDLHAAYRPKCEEMCERISQAHVRLDAVAKGASGVSPELEREIIDHAELHAECQREMLNHLYRTAAVLDEEQARRYLDEMLPYALDFSHSEPEGSQGH